MEKKVIFTIQFDEAGMIDTITGGTIDENLQLEKWIVVKAMSNHQSDKEFWEDYNKSNGGLKNVDVVYNQTFDS